MFLKLRRKNCFNTKKRKLNKLLFELLICYYILILYEKNHKIVKY